MKEGLVLKLKELMSILGRIPTRDEYHKFTKGTYSSRSYKREFGSYTGMLISQGLKEYVEKGSRIVSCKNCNTNFKKTLSEIVKSSNNFCNSICSAVYNNKRRLLTAYSIKKRRFTIKVVDNYVYIINIVKCRNCSKLYRKKGSRRSDTSTCSVFCRLEYGMKIKIMEDCINRSGANTYDLVRDNARKYSKYFYEPRCENCGYDKHYEVCHIKDLKDFTRKETLFEVNNKDNLVHLCPNCHWEFDKGLLKLGRFQ